MPKTFYEDDLDIKLRFGGGLNTSASEDSIDPRECVKGSKNFDIDIINDEFRPRPPFDLIDTAPNAASINGFVNLIKSDGTIELLVQAGANVYNFNGTDFDASPIATGLSTSSKLRGRIEHNFTLDDKVIITDLAKVENVKEWDGATWQDISHNLGGTFKAKYCFVDNERAWYGNVDNNGTDTPHLIAASKGGDYDNLTTSDKPSSAISEDDPFFLLAPDLKPINGLLSAFGHVIIGTELGSTYHLRGSTSQDFNMHDLYTGAFASGDEAFARTGNDVVYGRPGVIESVLANDKYGDVQGDDLSNWIKNEIKSFKDWNLVYNSRTRKLYCFSENQSKLYVCNYPTLTSGSGLSPWILYQTAHSLAFQPTCAFRAFDPSDGLEYVYMGDSSGNFYRMEGTGTSGDGGTDDIEAIRTSGVLTAPKQAEIHNKTGYVKYRKGEAYNLDMTFLHGGMTSYDETREIQIPAAGTSASVYSEGTTAAYNDTTTVYGNEDTSRIFRQKFSVPGQSEEFQIKLRVEDTASFKVNEVGIQFEASNL